jgi:hypothetical protein
MKDKEKEIEKLIFEAGRPILQPIGLIQFLLLVLMAVSFFGLIWGNFWIFGKIFLSALFGLFVFSFAYKQISNYLWLQIDKKIKEDNQQKEKNSPENNQNKK